MTNEEIRVEMGRRVARLMTTPPHPYEHKAFPNGQVMWDYRFPLDGWTLRCVSLKQPWEETAHPLNLDIFREVDGHCAMRVDYCPGHSGTGHIYDREVMVADVLPAIRKRMVLEDMSSA